MLRELKVVEQRYRAVLEVLDGIPVTEVAERFGVARQTVHRWVARYRDGGIDGLADRSHAPKAHPWRVSAEVEAVICDLRGSHRRWGPRRLVFELGKRGYPGISRSTVYRVLVRRQLLEPVPRRRRRDQYRRWERSAAMELWQLDVTASLFLADGRECKIVTGIDDHSRFCVIATVVARATARAVCSAFVTAMAEYGIPGEVLSDNGKQFTGRFGRPRPAEVLFERICGGERHHPAADQAQVPDYDGEDRAAAPDASAGAAERARPVRQHRGRAGRGRRVAQAVQL
jgi:transposase